LGAVENMDVGDILMNSLNDRTRRNGKRRKNNNEAYKAVFSVTIDTNNEYRYNTDNSPRNNPDKLMPFGKYWFDKEKHATYDDLKDFAIRILRDELSNECEQFIDIPILEIKVANVYEGSIELFFTVLFGIVSGVTGIKDLYDSIDFLRTLAEKKLQKRFLDKYGDYFRIDVYRQIPRDRQYHDFELLHKRNVIPLHSYFKDMKQKRDGFFYYLLVSNILLFATVIALVFRAIIKVYFT